MALWSILRIREDERNGSGQKNLVSQEITLPIHGMNIVYIYIRTQRKWSSSTIVVLLFLIVKAKHKAFKSTAFVM